MEVDSANGSKLRIQMKGVPAVGLAAMIRGFKWWPEGREASQSLEAHQAQLLLAAGDPSVQGAPVWRPVK